MKRVKLKVIQGAPIVNNAYAYRSSENIVAIEIDLTSKYCIVEAVGSGEGNPCILVGTTDRSLHLSETKNRDAMTEISFPEYGKDWLVWAADIGRYTLTACLVKMRKR